MPIAMPLRPVFLALALTLLGPGAAHAERADRLLPMVVESDGKQAASVDLARKVTVINGNVSISQGSLLIRAERVEIREASPGRFVAQARGTPDQPSRFQQKRDRLDEVIQAEADRVEYDSAAERVRFSGNARLRVLRGGSVTDEASAAAIVYDQKADTLVFEGGAPTAAAPQGGRARLVFVPRSDAASEPARPAASGAAR